MAKKRKSSRKSSGGGILKGVAAAGLLGVSMVQPEMLVLTVPMVAAMYSGSGKK
jgi:hypothetical protein